jgi:hypothetical protein
VIFPSQFDPFVGEASLKFKESEPTTWYIECECKQLGKVWCTVEHWRVWITGSTTLPENTEVEILIKGV